MAGAISYYLDHPVVRRIVRYTYGAPGSTLYDPSDPEHRKRVHKKYLGVAGENQLDIFIPTLLKVANVRSQISRLKLNRYPGYAGSWYSGIPQEGCLL